MERQRRVSREDAKGAKNCNCTKGERQLPSTDFNGNGFWNRGSTQMDGDGTATASLSRRREGREGLLLHERGTATATADFTDDTDLNGNGAKNG
jgi:hypothetical protein